MKTQSNFTLAKQKNGRAFYASLAITVDYDSSSSNDFTEVNHLLLPQENMILAKIGIKDTVVERIKANQQSIEQGFDRLIHYLKKPTYIRITITALDWNPIDTTSEALIYASFYALKQALNINIPENELPYVDENHWKIVFPNQTALI